VPANERLLMDMVEQALIDAGKEFRPFADGPKVKAVAEEAIRQKYYARMAEKAEPDETPETVAERQRKAFRRSLNAALKAKRLIAVIHESNSVVWLP